MPSKKLNSLVKDLRRLSLRDDDDASEEDIDAMWKARAVSSYQTSYQPMAAGLRTTLWADGYRQREERKKGGFTHFKLEWMVPTFRGKSLSSSPELSNSPDNPEGVEKLSLLPTKLEKKRVRLERLYDRKLRRLSKKALAADGEAGQPKSTSTGRSKYLGITDYERNRLNNMKSQIVLPTLSSCASTARLSTMSLSQRSVISAKSRNETRSPKKTKHENPDRKVEEVESRKHGEHKLPKPKEARPPKSKPAKLGSPVKEKQMNSPKKSPVKKVEPHLE